MVEPPYGDGDRLGVDLALVFLERKVAGVQPYSLPYPEGDALLGQVVYFAGFGSLVDGENGVVDASNTSRVAGQNQVDRDIAQVQIDSIPSEQVGGVFAFDLMIRIWPVIHLEAIRRISITSVLVSAIRFHWN